ncbi:hypothetical protein REPUB_Repub05bG0040800 [Reevesia pubescens]
MTGSEASSSSTTSIESSDSLHSHLNLGAPNPEPSNNILSYFGNQYLDLEIELYAQIRLLESRFIDRLPPQLDHSGYETLVRENLNQAINIQYYHSALSHEIFDITKMHALVWAKYSLRVPLGTGKIYYKSTGIAPIYTWDSYRIFMASRLSLNLISIPILVYGLMTPKSHSLPLYGMRVKRGLHTTEAKWFMIESQRHFYHLVDPSPWPISGSLRALASTVGGVMHMHSFQGGARLLSLGLIFILYTMFVWWHDVLCESTSEGHHTKVVQLGLRYGFILFIVSEVMFFFAFFWASSHSSLALTEEIGGIWPPKGIGVLDPWEILFLNTPILLSSGAVVTWAHHAILAGKEKRAVYAL